MSAMKLKAPFPWFGGKSRVADLVWERFGPDVPNYVEPFAGSLAVMLARPAPARIETVNDLDCFLANFWRAVQHAPEEVARWADAPVNEADLHARHLWLVSREEFREKMKTDPHFFDAKIAGWWVWGLSCWIGSGWCSKPASMASATERLVGGVHPRIPDMKSARGVTRQIPMLKSSDGVNQRNPRTSGQNVWIKRPELKRGGRGVVRQIPDIGGDGSSGRGVHAPTLSGLHEWMLDLAARLRRVRVCCGDWKRVLGRSPTECVGVTAIFLDPPYATTTRDSVYGDHDSTDLAHEVRAWAIANGDNPKLRIALCGYAGEHALPKGWDCLAWKANGGHGNAAKEGGRGRANALLERVWFSPHCLHPKEPELFQV